MFACLRGSPLALPDSAGTRQALRRTRGRRSLNEGVCWAPGAGAGHRHHEQHPGPGPGDGRQVGLWPCWCWCSSRGSAFCSLAPGLGGSVPGMQVVPLRSRWSPFVERTRAQRISPEPITPRPPLLSSSPSAQPPDPPGVRGRPREQAHLHHHPHRHPAPGSPLLSPRGPPGSSLTPPDEIYS